MNSEEDVTEELDRQIVAYIVARKATKVDAAQDGFRKGKLDAEALQERLRQLDEEHAPRTWIESAAKRASQIRIATHIAKAVHPDSRASSMSAEGASTDSWTGTPASVAHQDVSGNAAAMDVNGFLSISVGGRTVGARLMAGEPAMMRVLERHGVNAVEARASFAATFGAASTVADTWLKQVYFPVADDRYHLLAPLYPSALVHELHGLVREARFGEAAKRARQARRERAFHEDGLVEYPDLVLMKFGSGKPQNISALTNSRRGEAYLLPSLPPIWHSRDARPIWGTRTVFERVYPRSVRRHVDELASYLSREPGNNIGIRRHRAELVRELVDGLVNLELRMRLVDGGWSADERCELPVAERLWLDPERATADAEFAAAYARAAWRPEIAEAFARWLNAALSRAGLPVGYEEHRAWRDEALDALGGDDDKQEGGSDALV